MYNNVLLFLSVATIGLLHTQFCTGVIILDSGNPARFIRGTFVDVNQPEFFSTSISEKLQNQFPVQESVQTLNENILQSMTSFNEAMISAMKKEVEKTDAVSAVNTCRFSRARLTATRIKNNFESHIANVEVANTEGSSSNSILDISKSLMAETAEDFDQMIEDLHPYDVATHGKEAMTHFQNALKNFNSLQLVLASI